MLRSLFSAISGLRANQTMLDVTGNNIANANTAGFKGSNVVFQDTLSQMLTGASAPAGTSGGTNPIQVGLGVSVGGTTGNFNQGSAQTTGRATDLMIQGDGFFILDRDGESLYTRAGAFSFDMAGNLVSLDGDLVQGYLADAAGNINPAGAPQGLRIPELVDPNSGLVTYSIGGDGLITGVFDDGSRRSLAQLALADFVNPEGLERAGDTAFRASTNSGAAQVGAAGSGRLGTITGGALEMSNVDLAQEFTNLIVAQRGFQANSRVITTSDEVLQELVNLKR
ncbi:MAG TPA: flagellar hook-basal body complex protein [Nocardioidaceae bacterium]|nr:flagellar hook-basal body complex protein [Nocardioidaceae bacterium]